MRSVTAWEAKTRFGKLLARVAKGEEVVITKHEKPVARIVPEGKRDLKAVRAATAGLRALQQEIRSGPSERAKLSYAEARSAVQEGRR